jgi:hypothetical protein
MATFVLSTSRALATFQFRRHHYIVGNISSSQLQILDHGCMVASKTNRPSASVATPERTRSRTISKSPSSPLRRSPRNHNILDVSDSDDPSEIPDSQDSQAPKSQQRRLVSWIWNHGYLTEDEESWRCGRCNEPPVEFKISSTTHARGHLRKVRDISIREQGSWRDVTAGDGSIRPK